MRRIPQKNKGYAFYIPSKKAAGNGVRDAHGSTYTIHGDGSLRLVNKVKHGSK